MSRYQLTVIGDSFSAGWGDPTPNGGYRGWVSRFASLMNMQPHDVHNLARYGATTRHAIEHQLPAALAGKGPLVVVFIGVNDLLDPKRSFDVADLRRNVGTLFDALTGADTTVVAATFPDIPANLEVSEFVRHSLRRRFAEANVAMNDITTDAGVTCIDLTQPALWRDSTMWDADRLHPGPRLHQHFAEELMEVTEGFGLLAAA